MAEQQVVQETITSSATPYRIDVKLHDILMEQPQNGKGTLRGKFPVVFPLGFFNRVRIGMAHHINIVAPVSFPNHTIYMVELGTGSLPE